MNLRSKKEIARSLLSKKAYYILLGLLCTLLTSTLFLFLKESDIPFWKTGIFV